jgi:hypothetical protein
MFDTSLAIMNDSWEFSPSYLSNFLSIGPITTIEVELR